MRIKKNANIGVRAKQKRHTYVFEALRPIRVSEIPRHPHKGKENLAIRGLFESFGRWQVEEVKPFKFEEASMAERFRALCANYIRRHALEAVARRVEGTVYVYKIEKEVA